MNRKMRRMLEKKGGVIADMMKEMEEGGMLDELDNGTVMKLLKDKSLKVVLKLMRKHRNDEGTTICPTCHQKTHYKGVISRCECCGEWGIVEEIVGEEVDERLYQVVDIMNQSNKNE